MTDKVQKIREEVVSIDFEQELYKAFGQVKDFTLGMQIAKWFYDMGRNSQEPVSEDLFEASAEYAATGKILANGKEMIDFQKQKAFKAGAKWYASHNTKLPDNLLLAARKASIDMCNIDDKHLDEYPYHPIAEQKFIEGAQWQKEHLWKPSDGDDLKDET